LRFCATQQGLVSRRAQASCSTPEPAAKQSGLGLGPCCDGCAGRAGVARTETGTGAVHARASGDERFVCHVGGGNTYHTSAARR
jgi:hypothetical protein